MGAEPPSSSCPGGRGPLPAAGFGLVGVGVPARFSRRVGGRDRGAMRSIPSAAGRQVGPARPRLARDSAAACMRLSEGRALSPGLLSKLSSYGDRAPAAGPAPVCRVTSAHALVPASMLPTAKWWSLLSLSQALRGLMGARGGSDRHPVLVHSAAHRIKPQLDEAQQVKLVSPRRSSSSGHQQMLAAEGRGVMGGRHSHHHAHS